MSNSFDTLLLAAAVQFLPADASAGDETEALRITQPVPLPPSSEPSSCLRLSCSFLLDREVKKRTLGLILLQADESLEEDAKVLFPSASARLHHVRIPSSLEVSEESLLTLKDDIGAAASRLPASSSFDTIAFCCTSASSVIGSNKVEAIIRANCQAALKSVTNPLVAAIAAFNALGVKRVGLISPYVDNVNVTLIKAFRDSGIEVTHSGSFEQEEEAKVARIDEESLVNACLALYEDSKKDGQKKFEAIFMSCTNLVTLGAIPRVEAATGLPALSSNLCLCWHMAQQAGGGLELDINMVGGTSLLLQRGYQ